METIISGSRKNNIDITWLGIVFIIVSLAFMTVSVTNYLSGVKRSTSSRAAEPKVPENPDNKSTGVLLPAQVVKSLSEISGNNTLAGSTAGNATVVFAKQQSDGSYLTIGGFLYAKNKIVTVKHVDIDSSWIYAYGPDFGKNFSDKKHMSDIDHVKKHGNLDLQVVVLKKDSVVSPVTLASSAKQGDEVSIGSSRDFVWKTVDDVISGVGRWDPSCINSSSSDCVCLKDEWFCKKDNNKNFPVDSIFSSTYGLIAPGDCGSAVVGRSGSNKDKVFGYAFGAIKHGRFDAGRSLFVNVSLSEVQKWINGVK